LLDGERHGGEGDIFCHGLPAQLFRQEVEMGLPAREWAMNIFVDGEFGGRGSTSAGFAQSVEVPLLLPEEKLEIGLEMQYRSGGETIEPDRTIKGLVIGPTLAWRPTKSVRFDLPLFGCSDHTPALQMSAVFSLSFGGIAEREAETPASARDH
jgi:hypothetical protein